MSDPNTPLDAEYGGHAPPPKLVSPPSVHGQGRRAPPSNSNPAPARMPLFRR
jgi:hypothetical protein